MGISQMDKVKKVAKQTKEPDIFYAKLEEAIEL